MEEKYQPRYQWKRTQIDDKDPPTDFDWIGQDGVHYIGRIRKELDGTLKGQWHWAGSYPRTHTGAPPAWNAGHAESARAATQKVEEYWDLCMRVMTPAADHHRI